MTRPLTLGALGTLLGIAGGWYGSIQHYGQRVDALSSAVQEIQKRQAATYQLLAAIATKVGVTDAYVATVTPLVAPPLTGDNRR